MHINECFLGEIWQHPKALTVFFPSTAENTPKLVIQTGAPMGLSPRPASSPLAKTADIPSVSSELTWFLLKAALFALARHYLQFTSSLSSLRGREFTSKKT